MREVVIYDETAAIKYKPHMGKWGDEGRNTPRQRAYDCIVMYEPIFTATPSLEPSPCVVQTLCHITHVPNMF